MTNTRRLIAALAAVGTMVIGSAAFAAPQSENAAPVPPRAQWTAPCLQGYATMEGVMTLTAEQKPLWDAYVTARSECRQNFPGWNAPAADEQQRLDRRVERSEARVAQLKKVRDARAALLKSLSVEQKYVLESFEFRHRGARCGFGPGVGPRGPHHGWGHGMGPRGPHHGFGPGKGAPVPPKGPGYGWGPGMNPNCPLGGSRL